MKRVLAFLFFLVEAAAQPGVVAIRGARVIDGTGAPAQAAIVLIRGSRIEAVGADVAIPPGARIVEAAGETLIPGLFDLHTHLSASAVTGAPAALARATMATAPATSHVKRPAVMRIS